MGLDRRTFLKLGMATSAAAALDLRFLHFVGSAEAREKKSEQLIRSTCSPNCTGACGFQARVYDGRIVTLTQAADYPEAEYNPRGCLKGLSMMNLIYGKDRLKYPLIRTGARGSGQFKKVSWEEALDFAAGKLKTIMKKYGSEAVALTVQVPGTGFVHKGAFVRLAGLNHWTIHHGYDQNGDLPMFWPMTFGVQSEEFESLEWPNARYTMVFGSNIVRTRIPDAQHLIRAKENGKVVVFDPDFCDTAAKADEWVSLKPDTDAAMALGLAKVIIDRKLYDADFMRDFSDMPILVRKDTGKRLLASDVKGLADTAHKMSAPDYRSVFVILTGRGLTALNPESLKPTGAELNAELDVKLVNGEQVRVRTVFAQVNDLLKGYTPEKVSAICRVPAETIERLAVEAATRKPLHVIYGASDYQWYNGDLKGRALSLLPVLTGNLGRSGAGISTYAGQYKIRSDVSHWWFTPGGRLNWVPYLCFLQGKGINYPPHGIKAMIGGWGNPFDQHNMADILKKRATSGDLEFILTFDFQMTTSGMWSDVVFPATTWYENYELTATILHPYLQLQQPAVKPMFQSRTGIWVARELAKRLNPEFEKFFYPQLDEDQASLKVIDLLLKTGGWTTKGITLDMVKKGPVRLHSKAPNDRQIPFYEQIHDREPFPPRSYPPPLPVTAKFLRSGRIEFYREEDIFLKTGEQLPVHKETYTDTEYKIDPSVRHKFKLRYITKNSLYRVHSTHSNNAWMNELQGHEARVYLNEGDAQKRGIREGDRVEVYNNRGRTTGLATIDPGCRQGTVIFLEGWWARYLEDQSYNSLTYPWIKPCHEVYFVPGIWSPTTSWNECLVEVRRKKS